MAMTGGKAYLVKSEHPNYGERAWTIDLYVYVKEQSRNIAENYTVLSLGMYVDAADIGPWVKSGDSYIGTATSGSNCIVFDGAIPNFQGTRWLIENQNIVVPHNPDGTKTATIYWKWGVNSPWGQYVKPSGSINHTITPIPRQATITSVSNIKDTDNPSFTFNNPGGFPMDVWLEPNPVGAHLCERKNISNTGSYAWTLTEAERNALRNGCADGRKNCPIRVGLYTYINGVQYYDYRDVTYTLTENDATVPSVAMDAELNNSLLPSKFAGMCIQGKSKVDVTIHAEGLYGADINSLYGEVDGKIYNKVPFTSDVVNSEGDVDVIGYATDSRGFTGSDHQNWVFTPYSKPLVVPMSGDTAIRCFRSDGNGVKVGKSTSVRVQARTSFYSLSSKNTCALEYRIKPSEAAWSDSAHQWKTLIAKSSTAQQYNGFIPNEVFDQKKSYTVQIRAIDDIGEYDVKTFDIPTEDVALHLGKGGKKVAIGTYCTDFEDYTFFSEWKAIFDKGIEGVLNGEVNGTLNGTIKHQFVSDVLEFAFNCPLGMTPFITHEGSTNIPSEGNYKYSSGLVQKRADSQMNIFITNYVTGDIAVNIYANGNWNGWKFLRLQ